MPEVTTLPAFYLPGLKESDFAEFVPLEFGSDGTRVKMQAPVLTPDILTNVISSLLAAREEYLVKKPVLEIVEAIGRAIDLWNDPEYPPLKLASRLLPTITGFSSPMVELILKGMLSMFAPQNLKLLLEDEFEDPLVLDEFRPRKRSGGYIRAYGPSLTTIISAGNAPGASIMNTIYGLLMKSAVLVKSSSDEPLFATLFAQSIAEADPQLAR